MDSHVIKTIRAPSLKRGKNDEKLCDRIKLKKVLGLTVCSNAALDVSQTNGVLAYPAGCTVVLFNSKKLSQSFLLNSSRKAITAVTYSQCGRYIATGECGLNPTIKVWELDLQQNGNTENGVAGTIVAEFPGHKYAINCVAFSPTGKYLVSVGSQHDMIVNVFDWRQNLKIASNKVSAKVVAVSFSEDGSYFVTVGNRHVKYWYLDGGRKYKEPQPIPLMGRSAILGELRNNDFCAVACGKGERADSTYAITRNGQLVEFNSRRLLDKWVACRTTSANCLCVSSKYILVGCAESIIRCFNADNLEYITTLPRTHYLGVDVAQGIQISHMMSAPPNAKYPDTIAIVYDENRAKVSCVYNDHSLYIWDLRDIRRVGKSHSFLYHSACIWGVESVPLNFTKLNNQISSLPLECFLTCSSDNTIRVWGLDDCENTDVYRKNIYSKELMKIMYIDDELNFIKDMDNPILSEKLSSYDGRNGVRSIRISPDRTHLATGDRSGNIRIYDLKNSRMITSIEAHDSEVLCLEYTNEKIDRRLLASASRDRLIHVFDVLDGYSILHTLDDHSSSITSVRFIGFGMQFQMVSCGADKSIIFRNFQNNQFTRGNNCSGKNTLYDMEIDSNSKHILTACQDRNIRVYGTHNAKHTKTFKGSHSDDGSLIKLSLDLSGIYIATSCTDKTLSVYDYYSGECMARMYGHSELVTGLKFTNDCKHLISASGDGCVFLWQVPHDMIVTMQARLSQQAMRYGQQVPRPIGQSINDIIIPNEPLSPNEKFGSPPNNFADGDISPMSPGYRFSDVGQLPQWAKRKTSADESVALTNSTQILGTSPSQTQLLIGGGGGVAKEKPRGRWAQRTHFEPESMDLRNLMVDNQPLNHQNNNSSDYNSSSSRDIIYNNTYLSEDSSIDSGMENRREMFLSSKNYNKTTLEQKNMNSLNSESNTEHDGDVEDISDGERTSSDHGMIFYPPPVAPGTPTEFKVNEMSETELRKSMRRQKLEKSGLVLAPQQSAPSTGTGTSDDEDEGSTPSGDNADRSLASTLGGSSESIPQQSSSSFLQAALDGPGSLTERGSAGRKSISAMHNRTDNGKAVSSLSKSFTNSKKEELMKVINDAKQKLENVGYRSNLRTSQSISDLSHQTNMEMNFRGNSRTRSVKGGDYVQNCYLNCAAPKSVLTQNCNLIRKLQQDYPPYPNNLGNYTNLRPKTLEIPPIIKPSSHYHDSIETTSATITTTNTTTGIKKSKKHPGILKNYKSCPVSPVHEELDWGRIQSQSSQITLIEPPKRHHSMYSEDARSIFDIIHADTEKMIAEITSKYGDLDDYKPTVDGGGGCGGGEEERFPKIDADKKLANKTIESLKCTALREKNEHGFLSDEDGNFSSDSLEDCSLNLDISGGGGGSKRQKKTTCKKHNKKTTSLPKRSVSDYFIYDDFRTVQRKVSLSDILNDNPENRFLETQRHSSASFFLGQHGDVNKSQESIWSEEYSAGAFSYYNSMESILSDESECKSAPLEVLFGRGKCKEVTQRYSMNIEISSKSYGSSPNATNEFDYYMQNEYMRDFDNKTPTMSIPTSNTYPRLAGEINMMVRSKKDDEYIPSLAMKNLQYGSGVSKSLSKEFANQRLQNNTNPMLACDGSELFVRKEVKAAKSTTLPITREHIFGESSTPHGGAFHSGPPAQTRKSCSFEIPVHSKHPTTKNDHKRFEKNLEKFNRDRQTTDRNSYGGTLEMGYVPHKPPVAQRRTSSMRNKSKPKLKEKQPPYVRREVNKEYIYYPKKLLNENINERTFDLYIAEKGITENENRQLEIASDEKENSLKCIPTTSSLSKYDDVPRSSAIDNLLIDSKLITSVEYAKFRDLEKKIDCINKLVELEEKKLENERILKENRMKPLIECDPNSKGYVKHLSENFDKLARAAQNQLDIERSRYNMSTPGGMKRNFSLPDVLEGAQMQAFQFDDKFLSFTESSSLHRHTARNDTNRTAFDDDDDNGCGDDGLNDIGDHVHYDEEGIQAKSFMSAHDDDSLIRRACSLSDLSMGKGFTPSNSASLSSSNGNHKPIPTNRTSVPNRLQNKTARNSGSSKLSVSGMGMRSVSVGMLNQASDSETEPGRGGLLRPTISSQNKINGVSGPLARSYSNAKNSSGIINRRRGIQNAHSSVNLSTMGQDDSSSEEAPTTVNTPSGKPAVPPRPRSISVDHKRFNNTPVNVKLRSGLEMSPMDLPCKDTDIANADLTSQLCSNIINQLKQTTTSVMQLYQRLEHTDDANGKNMMLKELESAMYMTQSFFNKITRSDPNFPNQIHNISGSEEFHQNTNEFLQLMDNCSDILNNARKHVEK